MTAHRFSGIRHSLGTGQHGAQQAPLVIGPGEARISEMPAEDWLAGIDGAKPLLTDLPYSTDVDVSKR